MAQPLQAGQAQRRQRSGAASRRRQRRQVAVGEGQHHDLGRRLPEIDGGVGLRRAIADSVGQEMHRSAPESAPRWRRASRPFSPITTSRPARASPGRPGPVELVPEARADALHQQPHRLARHVDEALDAQDVVARGALARRSTSAAGRPPPASRRRSSRSRRGRAPLGVVMRRPRGEIGLGGGAEPEQDGDRSWPCGAATTLTARGTRPISAVDARRRSSPTADRPCSARRGRRRGAGPRRLRPAGCRDRATGRPRAARPSRPDRRRSGRRRRRRASTTAMTPSTVTRERDRRPVEGLHQRLGQREARGLDQDMVGRRRRDRAAPPWSAGNRPRRCSRCSRWRARRCRPRAALDRRSPRISPSTPTSPNSLTMTARRRPPAFGQHMADERRLAGAEEAGDDGAGNLGEVSCALLRGGGGIGGTRETARLRT